MKNNRNKNGSYRKLFKGRRKACAYEKKPRGSNELLKTAKAKNKQIVFSKIEMPVIAAVSLILLVTLVLSAINL